MIDDPEGSRMRQAELARAVAGAAVSLLTAQDHFNRLEEDELLRGRYDPDTRSRWDAINAAGRAVRAARARARFARAMWRSWQTEHGQADGMALL